MSLTALTLARLRLRVLVWRLLATRAALRAVRGVVDRLAQHLARAEPGLRGFSVQNLWRMRQLFETYRDAPKLSPLVRALPWTHNLIILGQSKRAEEREFYLRMAVQQRWGKRDATGSALMQFVQRMDTPAPDTFRIFLGEACGFVLEALGKPSSNVPFIMPKRVADTPADTSIDPPDRAVNASASGPATNSTIELGATRRSCSAARSSAPSTCSRLLPSPALWWRAAKARQLRRARLPPPLPQEKRESPRRKTGRKAVA